MLTNNLFDIVNKLYSHIECNYDIYSDVPRKNIIDNVISASITQYITNPILAFYYYTCLNKQTSCQSKARIKEKIIEIYIDVIFKESLGDDYDKNQKYIKTIFALDNTCIDIDSIEKLQNIRKI